MIDQNVLDQVIRAAGSRAYLDLLAKLPDCWSGFRKRIVRDYQTELTRRHAERPVRWPDVPAGAKQRARPRSARAWIASARR